MSRRPDILFVIGTLQVGGSEMHLLQISTALAGLGWNVSICSLAGDGPLRHSFEAGGVEICLPPVRRRASMNTLARLTKLGLVASYLFGLFAWRRPKIVHFFLPQAYLTGAPLAMLALVPIRVMSRRSLNNYQKAHPSWRQAELICHRFMAAILGNSKPVMRDLLEEGIPRSRLGLIYSGIDTARFQNLASRTALRDKFGVAHEALVFCIVANLIPYKGHADLIEALAIAAPELPASWRLLVAGRDDGVETKLRTRAAELSIDEHVIFLGPRSDVPELLATADVALSCSHEEGLSNAVLEAMASGLPTIVTDVGGNPEATIDGETGIVVPARNPARLARALVRLANDANLRATFGQAGRKRIADVFSLDRCIRQYDALYRALLAGRAPLGALGDWDATGTEDATGVIGPRS